MMNKLKKIKFDRIILWLVSILLVFVSFSWLFVNNFIYILFLLIVISFISFKIDIPKFGVCLFLFSLLSKIVVIFLFKPPIESDFYTMYEASKLLAHGDLSYTGYNYFITWGYQVGHVFYQALLLKIFDSVFFLKLVNCIFLSGTTVLIYLIVKEFINKKIAKFSSLLYLFYVHPVLLTTVLTNQHLPTFLFFLAFYILISDRFKKMNYKIKYVVVGVLIGIGNIMRPEGIVFVLSILGYLWVICLENDKVKDLIKKSLLILASYLLITKGCSLAFQITGISKSGLNNNDPLWKFVLGTNYDSGGWYDEDDCKYLGDRNLELQVIKSRTVDNPKQFIKLLVKKARVFWLGNNLYWSNSYLYNNNLEVGSYSFDGNKVNGFLNIINNHVYNVTFFLMIIGLICMLKNKLNNKKTLLFIILLCGYFVIYLFIENMIRYTYTPRVLVFVLSGYGIKYIYDHLIKKGFLK